MATRRTEGKTEPKRAPADEFPKTPVTGESEDEGHVIPIEAVREGKALGGWGMPSDAG